MTDYVIVKAPGGGGLGDCLKAVLVAAWYADLTNRSLIVDWRGGVYAEDGNDCFADFFEVCNVATSELIPESQEVAPSAWRNRLDASLHELWTEKYFDTWDREVATTEFSADLTKLDFTEQVLVVWDFSTLRALAKTQGLGDLSDIALYRMLSMRYLKLKASFEQRLREKLQQLSIEPAQCVGIHLRATNEFLANKGGAAWSQRIKAIRKALSSDQAIFLATDNTEVEALFYAEFSQAKALPKWFGVAGDSLHLNADAPSKRQVLEEALSDIVVLGMCKVLIPTTSSSFSELAQILAKHELPIWPIFGPSVVSRIVSRLRKALRV